jgi:hypothetical protein
MRGSSTASRIVHTTRMTDTQNILLVDSFTHVDHGISLRSTACVLGTGAVLIFK